MTAIRGYVSPTADQRALGVHSLDHFVLAVPDLKPAERFYSDFGLDVREDGNTLALMTFGHDHRWGSVIEGKRKRLHHLSFGCYADDLPYWEKVGGKNHLRIPYTLEANDMRFVAAAGFMEANALA